MEYSVVMPIRNEAYLLNATLASCYRLRPSEVILCFDNPPDKVAFDVAKKIAMRFGDIPTVFLKVSRNPEYKFHQAWVRRSGFLAAKYDRILTVDSDLMVNKQIMGAVRMVGLDRIGLVSCLRIGAVRGPLDVWRGFTYFTLRQLRPVFTGLYAIWRPYWLETEDKGIRRLMSPRDYHRSLIPGIIGEDTYLYLCMRRKYRCVFLRNLGGICLERDIEQLPDHQFEWGRLYAKSAANPFEVLIAAIIFAQPHLIRGYLHQKQKGTKEHIIDPFAADFNLESVSHSGKSDVARATR